MKAIRILLAIVCTLAIVACGDDGETTGSDGNITSTLKFTLPEGYNDATLADAQVSLTEVNTGKGFATKLDVNNNLEAQIRLAPGYYKVDVEGHINYKGNDGTDKQASVFASNSGVEITKDKPNVLLNLYAKDEPSTEEDTHTGFVLAEIFCAGTANAQGQYYYADKYFVIYNNTDHTLYADSLVIAESEFMTVSKADYNPNIMDTDMAVAAMYMIPGSGKDVPVQPGGKLLIVDNAINHTEANPNSWDETKADFEWYDESTDPQFSDIDNPDVPNLKRIYSKTLTMWSPHTQGFKSYALARMGTDENTFQTNYLYTYTYHLVGQTGEADMTGICYRLPNKWILDAVNMSVPAMFQWIVTSPSLDKGYTYCAGFGWDDSRFGKSVRRKVASRDNGRAILQDTNNSSDDFEPRTKADPFHEF